MSVRKIDKNGDWTFGQGLGNYITRDNEIAQNVATRLKAFKNDYFFDNSQNIDWWNILGVKNNESLVINEVRRVVQQTEGIQRVNDVSLVQNDRRNAIILIDFDTIYNKNVLKEVGINVWFKNRS